MPPKGDDGGCGKPGLSVEKMGVNEFFKKDRFCRVNSEDACSQGDASRSNVNVNVRGHTNNISPILRVVRFITNYESA